MIYVNGKFLFGPRQTTYAQQTLKMLMDSYNSSDNYSKKFSTKEVKDISAGSTSSQLTNRRGLYIMPKEFATVDPAKIDFVGTDMAVGTIGLIIRNRRSGMISIAHMDSPRYGDVENGLRQIVDSFETNYRTDDYMDVYMIGAVEYDDYPLISKWNPLTGAIVHGLKNRRENFNIQLLQVLKNNTRRYSEFGKPIFHGFMMETSNGSIVPARFNETSRIPDESLRRIRNIVHSIKYKENVHLFNVYRDDKFVIDPFEWPKTDGEYLRLKKLVDENRILDNLNFSQTPKAEPHDFEDCIKRAFNYWVFNDILGYFPRNNPRKHNV